MSRITSTIRWTGRATSVLSLGLLLLFLGPENLRAAVTPRQLVGLLFFPFGVALGLVLGWWREGLGAAVSVASLAGFYLVYCVLVSGQVPRGPWFVVFTAPALLFLATWLLPRLDRGGRNHAEIPTG